MWLVKPMAFDFVELATTIQAIATLLATIIMAYAGFTLATSTNPRQREEWKEVIAAVFVGLILLYLAPWIALQLSGGTYCK